ncbi:hypothetical protein LJY25_08140 [Hymenobacter sp. BT175]|uniref:hypothetical protein n=1 Tax=Hymenobacter translucens TaxID=2886507 RepID=UPI001D0F3199|nr:hypothetical protein [Hymenobacter translucens]MCC2546411.1 hypothetical protein [Hymenobacter translucens]
MSLIKMPAVLAEIDLSAADGQARTFSLTYHKTDGTKGHKAQVKKGGAASGAAPSPTSGGFRYKAKQHGTLHLVDVETGKAFALKIILLTHFNGVRILHV